MNDVISGFMSNEKDSHKIYYEVYNPNLDKTPWVLMHGGQGSLLNPKLMNNAFPNQKVIYIHQRGQGNSLPYGEVKDNTTLHLVEDVEKLRKKMNFDKVNLFGWSWGAALSFLYAMRYPEKINEMMIYGLFTANKNDIIEGYVSRSDENKKYLLELYDMDKLETSEDVRYMFDRLGNDLNSDNKNIYGPALYAYYNFCNPPLDSIDDFYEIYQNNNEENLEDRLGYCKVYINYIKNSFFMKDNYIDNELIKVKLNTTTILHGEKDTVTSLEKASFLANIMGANFTVIPNSDHDVYGGFVIKEIKNQIMRRDRIILDATNTNNRKPNIIIG